MHDQRRSHAEDQNLQGQAHSPIVAETIASRAKDECINWTPSSNHLWFLPDFEGGDFTAQSPRNKGRNGCPAINFRRMAS